MIVQSEMITIKSKKSAIRSVRFEFNHFTVDQMDILKSVISDYLGATHAIFTKGKSFVAKNGDSFVEKHLLNEGVRIYVELLTLLDIELHMYGKPIKKCEIYVGAPLNIDNITQKHIKQCIIKITRKISSDIYNILFKIDNLEIKNNYFIQDIAIWNGDFNGQYDFGAMRVDFGYPCPNRRIYKVARCFIRYSQYKVDMENIPIFTFIERESKIRLTLLQCFLRFPIYELSDDVMFLSSDFKGEYINVDRNDFMNEYIIDRMNNERIPSDIVELFSKYDCLSDDEKTVFYNAVCSYCEGMKNEGSKAVSYYVICLETIASYEAKRDGLNNISKNDMIYRFLNNIFTVNPIEYEFVEHLYSIRCAYVHNGIANNDFLEEVFMKSTISNLTCEIIERVTNYSLMIWLKKK